MEQSFDLQAIFSVVRRRYLYFVIPFVTLFAAVVVIAYSLPRSYEAQATILIESQRIPNELASATVNADPSERLKVIEQRLLSRDNLLTIAGKYALYREDGTTPSPTEIVEAMRGSVAINQIGVTRSRRNTQIIGFNVSFQYSSANMAARVANELVTSILSQNLETRLNRAAETSEFFQQQLRDLEAELLEMENKMAAYKRDNEEALPETIGFRRQKLTEITANLDIVNQQLRLLDQGTAAAATTNDASAQQLAFQLQSRELNYDAYVERKELLAPLLEKGFVSQRTMDDLERQIAQTEIEISSIKAQMEEQGFTVDPDTRKQLLEAQQTELERRATELRQSISNTPAIEVQLAAMVRDYDNLRAEYSQTKAKLTDAEIGERLEQDRQAERFEVLEQATTPESPTKPNRIQIVAAGGGGALAVAAGLVLLLEFLDNSIRTAGDLERRLKVRPIAVIPYVTTRQERVRRILRRILTLCVVLFGIVSVMAVVHLYVMPLDLLMERVFTRIEPFLPSFLKP